jgi:hypothetical protein
MMGSEQVRYCDECGKYVYNLSSMTGNEAEAIVATAKGRLCVRLTRDADGATLTEDRPAGLQLVSRRVSPIASAVVTAMMSISGVAHPASRASEPISAYSESGVKKPGARSQASDVSAALSGTVLDPSGAVIPNAKVTLTNEATGEEQTVVSSDEGGYRFTLLRAGTYALRFEAAGFKTLVNNGITLQANEDKRFDVNVSVAEMGETVTLGGAVASPVFPLRVLYKESDRIVIARVGETVKVQSEGERSLMRTTLNVSSNIKGEGKRSAIDVYHWIYEAKQDTYVSGDTLLVFLKKREGEKGRKAKDAYEVEDPQYGVKKLSEADLGIYLRRIEELAAIMRQDKPVAAEIVEWLVRCVEDPATRWEGAFELETSAAQLLEDNTSESDAADESDESAAGDASVEEAEEQMRKGRPGDEDLGLDSRFAVLLTLQQKDRLAAALFYTETITERDFLLVELIRDLGNARLAPFLVSQLRRVEANPTIFAGQIVLIMADLLKDDEINRAADEYITKASYEDSQATEEADESDNDETQSKELSPAAAAQQRSAMLSEFLSLVEKKMSAKPAKPLPR